MSSSQLRNSIIFQRGWNHQPDMFYQVFLYIFLWTPPLIVALAVSPNHSSCPPWRYIFTQTSRRTRSRVRWMAVMAWMMRGMFTGLVQRKSREKHGFPPSKYGGSWFLSMFTLNLLNDTVSPWQMQKHCDINIIQTGSNHKPVWPAKEMNSDILSDAWCLSIAGLVGWTTYLLSFPRESPDSSPSWRKQLPCHRQP